MNGVPTRRLLQGQTRDNSHTRFFHTKKEHIYERSYIISVIYIYIYMSFHILFEGINLVLSYFTHKWNAYITGNCLEIKKQEK